MYGVPVSLRMCAEVSYGGETAIASLTAARFGRSFFFEDYQSQQQSACFCHLPNPAE
jgi:hypothetical protein